MTTSGIPEGFEQVNCPGCGSGDWTLSREVTDFATRGGPTYRIVRCLRCGLHYTNPRPDLDHIGCYYPADCPCYHMDAPECERCNTLEILILANAYGSPQRQPQGWWKLLAKAASLVKAPARIASGLPYHGKGRLLDFGCGHGRYLRRMAACGWEVIGMDFSGEAVKAVRASGIHAVQGSLPHPELKPRSFDVVTMRHALEHVHQPVEVLKAAYNILDDGGWLLIHSPNHASWEVEHFGNAAFTLGLPQHLSHFTPDTLRALVTKAGFGVREARTACRTNWLRKSQSRAAQLGPKRMDSLLKLNLVLKWMARWCEFRGRGNELILLAEKPMSMSR